MYQHENVASNEADAMQKNAVVHETSPMQPFSTNTSRPSSSIGPIMRRLPFEAEPERTWPVLLLSALKDM
jgi:hypothetical protein